MTESIDREWHSVLSAALYHGTKRAAEAFMELSPRAAAAIANMGFGRILTTPICELHTLRDEFERHLLEQPTFMGAA